MDMDVEWISKAELPNLKNKSFIALLSYFGELGGFDELLKIIEYKK